MQREIKGTSPIKIFVTIRINFINDNFNLEHRYRERLRLTIVNNYYLANLESDWNFLSVQFEEFLEIYICTAIRSSGWCRRRKLECRWFKCPRLRYCKASTDTHVIHKQSFRNEVTYSEMYYTLKSQRLGRKRDFDRLLSEIYLPLSLPTKIQIFFFNLNRI